MILSSNTRKNKEHGPQMNLIETDRQTDGLLGQNQHTVQIWRRHNEYHHHIVYQSTHTLFLIDHNKTTEKPLGLLFFIHCFTTCQDTT